MQAAEGTPAVSWEHTWVTLLSGHIWPHLGYLSKQRLRLTSKALRAEVDRSISQLELFSVNDLMRLARVPWQLRTLAVHPAAASDLGWLYLKAASNASGLHCIAKMQALVLHKAKFSHAMQQALHPHLSHLTRLEIHTDPHYIHNRKDLQPGSVPWAKLSSLQAVVVKVKKIRQDDIEALLSNCQQLRSLELDYSKCSKALKASQLTVLSHLTHLKLRDASDGPKGDLEGVLSKLTGLQSLHVHVDNLKLSRLTGLQHLTSLSIAINQYTIEEEDFEHLANFTNLQHLDLQPRTGSYYGVRNAWHASLRQLHNLRSLAAVVDAQDKVETGAVAALTQLTSLQLCVPHGTEPDQLSSLSSLWNLQLFALEGGPLHFCLHTCLPAWQQKLQVLNLSTKSLYLQWEDLQLLASLPHLHSLTCYGIQLRCSEGQVCLPALRTLSFSMGDDIWTVAPSQVAALLVPVLESVRGKLCIQLLCDHRQDQEQMLADLQKAATGILQAASDVRVFYEGDHDGTPDDLLNIFQALTPWRPLQHGRECKLSLYWSALDSSTASVAALSHVPPAVQHLWFGGSVSGEALSALASHPCLERISLSQDVDAAVLAPLMYALSQQPPGRPLVVNGDFPPKGSLSEELTTWTAVSTAGGRALVPLPNIEYDSESSSEHDASPSDDDEDDSEWEDEDV